MKRKPQGQTYGAFALRLGFRQVDGMREEEAHAIVAARGEGYRSLRDLYFRTKINIAALRRLAHADAFRSVGLDRRGALWEVQGLSGHLGERAAAEDLPLFAEAAHSASAPLQDEASVALPALLAGEHVIQDYETLRLSLKAHPVSFLRDALAARRVHSAAALADHPADRAVSVAGLVLVRQRPGTASGVVFMTVEDETGIANIIVWPRIFETYRRVVLGARMIVVVGMLQKEQGVIHVVARRITDVTRGLFKAMTTSAAISAPEARSPAAAENLWRHPRDTRVLPKGRNFH